MSNYYLEQKKFKIIIFDKYILTYYNKFKGYFFTLKSLFMFTFFELQF